MTRLRADDLRMVLGAADVLAAPAVALVEGGHRPDRPAVAVVRVLGLRQLAQGALTRAVGGGRAHRIGCMVDVLHATSMVLLGVLDRKRRRAAMVQAGIAAAFAVAELRAAAGDAP